VTDARAFQRCEALFHELSDMPPAERERRLQQLRATDPGIAAELTALLSAPTGADLGMDALRDVAAATRIEALTGAAPEPTELGPYRLLRTLGEGGMGRVYLAEQTQPVRRTVALKLVRWGLGGDAGETRARFRAERQALAALDHTGIARVFDAGSSPDGRPWFAMEYIQGEPITGFARRRGLDIRQRIALLLPVCDAIQHAHQKGVIHRDLKPSNILVMDDGGIGQPKVIDFGVAKPVSSATDQRSYATHVGALVGTPEYMSPEQAALGAADVDTRADVYALGLVLYELLLGVLPVAGEQLRGMEFHAMCRLIREQPIARPSVRAAAQDGSGPLPRQLRGDLDAVLMKALAKDREQRYGSAAALAEDLRRYLSGQPVQARPPSAGYRLGKFVRRHRLPVAAAAVAGLALLVGAALAVHGLVQARRALAQAQWNLQQAELRNDVANSYADALRLVFGQDGDVERLTALLLAHATEQQAGWREQPERAALASFAVGRHFLSRNDYPTARAVFEPWLREGYGDRELQSFGWQLLAFAYRYTGERDLALSAFRRSGELAHPNNARDTGWASRLVNIALLSGAPGDHRAAIAAVEALLAAETNPTLRMTQLNLLFQLHQADGRFDQAHAAIAQAVQVIDERPDMDLAGRDTNRLNLARMELYHRGDLAAAQRQLDAVRTGDMRAKGESRESALVLELQGTLLRMRGDLAGAQSALTAAMPLYDRYVGPDSIERRRCEVLLAMTLVDLDQADAARTLLQAALTRTGADGDPGLGLAEVYLAARTQGTDAATALLLARAPDPVAIAGADYLRPVRAELAAAGVALPAP
jgi:serine/threonine protein kinase/tetratricopeptide (TPR) repeat protein